MSKKPQHEKLISQCNMVFDNNFSSPQFPQLVINQFAKNWLSANAGGFGSKKSFISVSWEPPCEDWINLNIDGCCDNVSGHITVGRVMCNHWKRWVKGFVTNKGVGNASEAELLGMFEGLTMAWNSGIRRIIVESDSLDIVQLINNDINSNHPLFSLIQCCKQLVEADWNCIVKHVFREGNRLADGLARMGHGMKNVVFEDPPPEVSLIYEDDCRGLAFNRQSAAPVSFH